MDVLKISQRFREYLLRPDVKNVCNPKIYKGLIKMEKDFRTVVASERVKTEDLDKFYSPAPAMVKLFKMGNVSTALDRYEDNYDGMTDEAKRLDVYNKALHFATIVKLTTFWLYVTNKNKDATLQELGISKSVFKRVNSAQQILDISKEDAKKKTPDKTSLVYLEMGLKRIISMEVGTDDWDK